MKRIMRALCAALIVLAAAAPARAIETENIAAPAPNSESTAPDAPINSTSNREDSIVSAADDPTSTHETTTPDVSEPGVLDEITTPTDTGDAVSKGGLCGTHSTAAEDTTEMPLSVELIRFDPPKGVEVTALPVNAPQHMIYEQIMSMRTGLTAYDAQGDKYKLVTDAWDISTLDTSKAGIYEVYADIPTHGTTNRYIAEIDDYQQYTLAPDVMPPRIPYRVSVQAVGQPELNVLVAARGFLYLPWILSPEQITQLDTPGAFEVFVRENSGEWEPLPTEDVFLSGSGLELPARLFTDGSSYSLYARYPGGVTGTLEFLFNRTPLLLGYSEGHRDGSGDSTTLPDTVQPPPNGDASSDSSSESAPSGSSSSSSSSSSDSPSTPSNVSDTRDSTSDLTDSIVPSVTHDEEQLVAPETVPTVTAPIDPTPAVAPAPPTSIVAVGALTVTTSKHINTRAPAAPTQPTEREREGSVTLSGLRVRTLASLGETLTVRRGTLTAHVKAETLAVLGLSDDALLSFTLMQPDEHTVALSAAVDDVPLASIDVILTVSGEPNLHYTITEPTGSSYEHTADDNGNLSLTAHAVGAYHISPVVAAQTASAVDTSGATAPLSTHTLPAVPEQDTPLAGAAPLVCGSIVTGIGGAAWFVWRKRP